MCDVWCGVWCGVCTHVPVHGVYLYVCVCGVSVCVLALFPDPPGANAGERVR